MATRLYSVSNDFRAEGDNIGLVVTEAVGSATVTTPIELTVDLSVIGLDRQRVLSALDRLADYLLEGSWPPV